MPAPAFCSLACTPAAWPERQWKRERADARGHNEDSKSSKPDLRCRWPPAPAPSRLPMPPYEGKGNQRGKAAGEWHTYTTPAWSGAPCIHPGISTFASISHTLCWNLRWGGWTYIGNWRQVERIVESSLISDNIVGFRCSHVDSLEDHRGEETLYLWGFWALVLVR